MRRLGSCETSYICFDQANLLSPGQSLQPGGGGGEEAQGAGRSSRGKLIKPPSTAREVNSCQEEGIVSMLEKHLLKKMC